MLIILKDEYGCCVDSTWQCDRLTLSLIALRTLIITYGSVKHPDAGKDGRQEEKGATEDEMVGWHHRLNGPEFEQAPGDSEGQGSLACCSPRGHKESDMTERVNNKRSRLPWVSCQAEGRGQPPLHPSSHLTRASVRTEQTKGRESCIVNNYHNNLHLMRACSEQAM